MTAAELWAPVVPQGAYALNGIIYFPEQEEAFNPDLLSLHPEYLALGLHEEYVRLYDAHGEEQAEAFLHEISNQLTSKTLSLAKQ